MSQAAEHETRKKTVFLDQNYLDRFLFRVEEVAPEYAVRREDIPLILEVLREKFGPGLPKRWGKEDPQ